jgi:Flp pilus assembly protein TadG
MPDPGSRRRRLRVARADERGAVAVEFALVLPILLLIVFGTINFGLLFSAQIGLNSAARDGARAGVVQPLTGNAMSCSAIATQARSNAGVLGVVTSKVGVTVTGPTGTSCTLAANSSTVTGAASSTVCTGGSSGGQLTVALAYTQNALVPIVPPQTSNLTGTGKFACEYS